MAAAASYLDTANDCWRFWTDDSSKHMCTQALPNKLALVVNHENVTHCGYVGQDRSFLLCNALFRVGGAAALMSNR